MNKFIAKVNNTIEKYGMIEEGDTVILAVSGGPDSICLLDIFNLIQNNYNISLIVAHVHHGIREKEADVEARFVRLKSFHLGIPYYQLTASVPDIAQEKGLSIEQAGRMVRYQYFRELLVHCHAQKIVLGHHADDQVETILMRLIRGSGLKGLRGIPPRRDIFIRPLIDCTREEIEQYCNKRRLTYCTDSSNKEPMFFRNKIRYQLIPLLIREYNPSLKKNLLQLQTIINDEIDFWDEITDQYFWKVLIEKDKDYIVLDILKLRDFSTGIQRSVIRRAVRYFNLFLKDIQFNHIENIRLMILKDEGEKHFYLPGGIKIRKGYQHLAIGLKGTNTIFDIEKPFVPFETHLIIGHKTMVNELGIMFLAREHQFINTDYEKWIGKSDKNEAILDFDKINFPLKIRNRRKGDRFQPINSLFFKKLKSFFIDQKVERNKRDKVALVVDNSDQIIWIAGFQIDNRYKVTDETKKILHIKQIIV